MIKDEITLQNKSPKITSVLFITEIHVIYEGIELANTLDFNDVLIITGFLNTFFEHKNTFPENEITQNIQNSQIQKKKKTILFMWVSLHNGVAGKK